MAKVKTVTREVKGVDNGEDGERTRTFLTGVPLGNQIVDQLFKLMTKANRDQKLRAIRNILNGAIAASEQALDEVKAAEAAEAKEETDERS